MIQVPRFHSFLTPLLFFWLTVPAPGEVEIPLPVEENHPPAVRSLSMADEKLAELFQYLREQDERHQHPAFREPEELEVEPGTVEMEPFIVEGENFLLRRQLQDYLETRSQQLIERIVRHNPSILRSTQVEKGATARFFDEPTRSGPADRPGTVDISAASLMRAFQALLETPSPESNR